MVEIQITDNEVLEKSKLKRNTTSPVNLFLAFDAAVLSSLGSKLTINWFNSIPPLSEETTLRTIKQDIQFIRKRKNSIDSTKSLRIIRSLCNNSSNGQSSANRADTVEETEINPSQGLGLCDRFAVRQK